MKTHTPNGQPIEFFVSGKYCGKYEWTAIATASHYKPGFIARLFGAQESVVFRVNGQVIEGVESAERIQEPAGGSDKPEITTEEIRHVANSR